MIFCRHSWKVLSETVTKSKLEVLAEVDNIKDYSEIPYGSTSRKIIQVFECVKCGKLKRFVEDI